MEDITLSKRERKKKDNRKKLFDALETLIKKYDYRYLTIRNICEVSGISYGSFYNIFENKDKFLVDYITTSFMEFKKKFYLNRLEFNNFNPFEKIIDIYICCGLFNEYSGIDYISGLYSSKNYNLYMPMKTNSEEKRLFTPLYMESIFYLKEAVDMGLLSKDKNLEEIARQFVMIFNGITFNWCISEGELSLTDEIRFFFSLYIKSIEE